MDYLSGLWQFERTIRVPYSCTNTFNSYRPSLQASKQNFRIVSISYLFEYWRNIEQPKTGRRLTQRKVSLLLL